jgi:hypothetical protein
MQELHISAPDRASFETRPRGQNPTLDTILVSDPTSLVGLGVPLDIRAAQFPNGASSRQTLPGTQGVTPLGNAHYVPLLANLRAWSSVKTS